MVVLATDIEGATYTSYMHPTTEVKAMVRALEQLGASAVWEGDEAVRVLTKRGNTLFAAIRKNGNVWIVRHPDDLFVERRGPPVQWGGGA